MEIDNLKPSKAGFLYSIITSIFLVIIFYLNAVVGLAQAFAVSSSIILILITYGLSVFLTLYLWLRKNKRTLSSITTDTYFRFIVFNFIGCLLIFIASVIFLIYTFGPNINM